MTDGSRVMGVGAALLDLLAFVPEHLLARVPGAKGGMELVDASTMTGLLGLLDAPPTCVPGGSAANTVVGLARLGVPARLLCKIGADANGARYRAELEAARVDTTSLKVSACEPTGQCLSLVTPDSQRTMRTCLGASQTLAPAEITAADFVGCTHAHVEGYLLFNRELMVHVLRTAKAAGCTVSLDLASPEVIQASRALLPGLIHDYVDMVFANEDEAATFAGVAQPVDALDRLSALCGLVAVKLGARGALVRRGTETVAVPAKVVQAVDTTGAGDLWAAGFLQGVFAGASLAEAGRRASAVAAAVVQQLGAVMPEETWRRLEQETMPVR